MCQIGIPIHQLDNIPSAPRPLLPLSTLEEMTVVDYNPYLIEALKRKDFMSAKWLALNKTYYISFQTDKVKREIARHGDVSFIDWFMKTQYSSHAHWRFAQIVKEVALQCNNFDKLEWADKIILERELICEEEAKIERRQNTWRARLKNFFKY